MQVLASIWGVFTTVPFLAFFLVYFITKAKTKNRKLAFQWSVNITNILLINSVAVLYAEIWPDGISIWIWFFLMILVIAGFLGWLQRLKRGQVFWGKIGFSTWRISFLLFSIAYMALFGTGIWKLMQVS